MFDTVMYGMFNQLSCHFRQYSWLFLPCMRRYGQNGNAMLGLNNVIVPFVACGDLSGFDADKSYPLQLTPLSSATSAATTFLPETSAKKEGYRYVYREPVCPPINPNHAESEKQQKGEKQSVRKVNDNKPAPKVTIDI